EWARMRVSTSWRVSRRSQPLGSFRGVCTATRPEGDDMTCPVCSMVNPEGSRSCMRCGTALAEAPGGFGQPQAPAGPTSGQQPAAGPGQRFGGPPSGPQPAQPSFNPFEPTPPPAAPPFGGPSSGQPAAPPYGQPSGQPPGAPQGPSGYGYQSGQQPPAHP